jgi:hypothetical protein
MIFIGFMIIIDLNMENKIRVQMKFKRFIDL